MYDWLRRLSYFNTVSFYYSGVSALGCSGASGLVVSSVGNSFNMIESCLCRMPWKTVMAKYRLTSGESTLDNSNSLPSTIDAYEALVFLQEFIVGFSNP
jgi:uncharacterized membrane protein